MTFSMSNNAPLVSTELDFRPRILFLHGGGTTADIFRAQCRSFIPYLEPHFRLVFPDAPFFCAPGPGIVPVYSSYGPPFRRWLRWLPAPVQAETDNDTAMSEIEYCLFHSMLQDDERGGRGEWVGLLGFSQGAKMAASLAYDLQIWQAQQQHAREQAEGSHTSSSPQSAARYPLEAKIAAVSPAGSDGVSIQWKFVVIMNGRPPFASLSLTTAAIPGLQQAGELVDERALFELIETGMLGRGGSGVDSCSSGSPFSRSSSPVPSSNRAGYPSPPGSFLLLVASLPSSLSKLPLGIIPRLTIPSIHVHGTRDPGLRLHQGLAKYFCDPETTTVVRWAGEHRVAIKRSDVEVIVSAIMDAAMRQGVIPLLTTTRLPSVTTAIRR